MRNPIYLAVATAACVYLALANARGWHPFYSLLPARFGPSGPGSFHK